MSAPLASVTVTLDGNGNGAGQVGPTVYGLTWHVDNTTTFTSSTASNPTLIVYRNVVTPTAIVDSTYNANQDSSDTITDLGNGEQLIFVWSGGDPGAQATAVVYGTYDDGRSG